MTPLTTCPDHQLLQRCGIGDSAALAEFVRRFSDIIFRTIQFSLHRRDVSFTRADLEDLHNTVFLRLFENQCKKLRQYRGTNGCSVKTWIQLITIRTVIDHLRKSARDPGYRSARMRPWEEVVGPASEEADALCRIQEDERGRLVHAALEKLSSRDRLFLKLHFLKDCPLAQVAQILNIAQNTAYSVKHRALKRLRAEIRALMDQEKN